MKRSWPLLVVVTLCPLPVLTAGEIVTEQNITYADVQGIRLQLDLARPKDGDGPFPGLVFIHGGGWSGGNRHGYRPKIEEAARRGYVAVTISYRLTQPDKDTGTPKVPFPAQIHDCKAAIRWLRAHAAEYKLDRDRIGVTGASAGGHLSLLVGLSTREDGLEGDEGNLSHSSRVQAVVNVFGPTDLARCYETSPGAVGFLKALCNGTPETAAAMYRSGSPVTFVTSDDPPVLTLHGDKDALVPPEQAKILDERMKAAGAKHELKVFQNQAHGFNGDAAKEADDAAWEFFERYLKPSPN